jgi:hypothetical protein
MYETARSFATGLAHSPLSEAHDSHTAAPDTPVTNAADTTNRRHRLADLRTTASWPSGIVALLSVRSCPVLPPATSGPTRSLTSERLLHRPGSAALLVDEASWTFFRLRQPVLVLLRLTRRVRRGDH